MTEEEFLVYMHQNTGDTGLHYYMGDYRTRCGLSIRNPHTKEVTLDSEGKPVKMKVMNLTFHDDWVTCLDCRNIVTTSS
jgi:hypothetical protein